MMNCFPILYRDELYYSIVSREKRICGIANKTALFRDFCNRKERQVFMYLPVHIKDLVANLPVTTKITEKYIIQNHTMYPYLTSFLDSHRAEEVFREMESGTKRNPLVTVGANSSSVKFGKYLKYCPKCYKEHVETMAESYWTRLNQLPGVYYCLKHKMELVNSNVPTNDNLNYYICADEIDVTNNQASKNNNILSQYYEVNATYVKSSEYLLSNDVLRKPNSFIMDFYVDKLRESKLASRSGVIYMYDFLKQFKDYYSEYYLELMQSNYEIDDENNWLRLFIRKDNKSKSVLRHLMLLQFLNVDVSELFKQTTIEGKKTIIYINTPRLDIAERKEQWLRIIEENPTATRRELKDIGKGIYTYIYKYEKEWYHKVTPVYKKIKEKQDVIDWDNRDRECLCEAEKAVADLLSMSGKPIRITKSSIRRKSKMPTYLKNNKLVKTHEYINSVVEDIENYRRRKILWAIKGMQEEGINLTVYKVHNYAGFGEVKDKRIRELIERYIN